MTDWTDAACHTQDVDPETFWTPDPRRPDDPWHHPRAICATCPLIDTCATHALTHPEPDGFWGGMSPDERRHIHEHLTTAAQPGPELHGVTAYRTGRCRCTRCTTANRRYQARYRARVA